MQKVPIAARPERTRDLTGCLIRDVLTLYPAWNGTNEREFIRSQQRPAPLATFSAAMNGRKLGKASMDVACVLMDGAWWTRAQLVEATGHTPKQVNSSLTYLALQGCVEREHGPDRDRMRVIQRYRWVR